MKTVITFFILIGLSISIEVKMDGSDLPKKSGQIRFEAVYKETEGFGMSSTTGAPTKQKIKMGNDFEFEFFFTDKYSRYQKIKEEVVQTQRRMSFNRNSFSSGGEEEPVFKFDEFDTAVFDYDKNAQFGLATVLERQIMVEVPIYSPDLGFKVSKTKEKIAGYSVSEAVSEDGTVKVWFTKDLDIHSLWKYKGIDGVVLGYEDEERTVKAVNIEFTSIDASTFELPERKLLELEQYQDLKKEEMDELMKDMQKRLKESGQNISFENGGIVIKKGGNN